MKFILITLFSFILSLSFSQNNPTFELNTFKYKKNSSKVNFQLEINNPTSDTIVILKPEPKHFLGHYMGSVQNKLGINQYPYSIDITKTDDCKPAFENERPVSNLIGSSSLLESNFVRIPPKTKIVLGSIDLDLWEWYFCSKSAYSFILKYKLVPKTIDAKTEKKLIKQIENIESEIEKLKDLLSDTDLKNIRIESGLNILQMNLNSLQNAKLLYTGSIESKPIVGTSM